MTVIIRNSLRHVGLSTLRRRRLPSTNSPFVSCQSSKSFRYVAHEGNSWQLRLPKTGVGILVDPWLVGKLTFADQDWLFKGSKISEMPSLKQVELETDLLLITQGLDDHAHRPTLKQLSKTTPVVASPSAATVCRELGFQDVTELRAGDRCTACDDRVSIWATEGALVGGPPWSTREAGFVIRERVSGGISVYYEPHCDFSAASVRRLSPVDVVISPVTTVELAGFPLVQGRDNIVELLRILRPSVLVPLLNGSFAAEGALSGRLETRGSLGELPGLLKANGLGNVRIAAPKPVEPLYIDLEALR
uniref:Zn-dependent hydrolase of the beta-lactamase fold protein n=1 Tax=Tetraselmis sp. GSL018 TaxID=582737 RepID=A0A061RPC4_9CHLO